MGQLYADATTVITPTNCCGSTIDIETYFSRAWTQQEFYFGSVIINPGLHISREERATLVEPTFQSSPLSTIWGKLRARSMKWNYDWYSEEADYLRFMREEVRNDYPKLTAQLEELWDEGYNRTSSLDEYFTLMENFRKDCLWNGSTLLGYTLFRRLFVSKCRDPKDQLFGVINSAVYSHNGRVCNLYNMYALHHVHHTGITTRILLGLHRCRRYLPSSFENVRLSSTSFRP